MSALECATAGLVVGLSIAWSPPARQRRNRFGFRDPDYATLNSYQPCDGTFYRVAFAKRDSVRPKATGRPWTVEYNETRPHQGGAGASGKPSLCRSSSRQLLDPVWDSDNHTANSAVSDRHHSSETGSLVAPTSFPLSLRFGLGFRLRWRLPFRTLTTPLIGRS